jgi:hypothetical protein
MVVVLLVQLSVSCLVNCPLLVTLLLIDLPPPNCGICTFSACALCLRLERMFSTSGSASLVAFDSFQIVFFFPK